jgi:hypothetical protein
VSPRVPDVLALLGTAITGIGYAFLAWLVVVGNDLGAVQFLLLAALVIAAGIPFCIAGAWASSSWRAAALACLAVDAFGLMLLGFSAET